VRPFSEGLAYVTLHLKGREFPSAFIDKRGKAIIQFPEGLGDAGPFSEGIAPVRLKGYTSVGKLGYIDRSGTLIVPHSLALGGPFRDGLAAVVFDGQCFVEARNGGVRGTPPSTPSATSCGGVPAFITKRCGEGFIDAKGRVVYRFDGVRDFSEGLAAVEKVGKWGFINRTGAFVIEPVFESARSFSAGLAAVQSSGKWGYIDRTGKWVIPPRYSSADDFRMALR
jgi:hypothetical protein